MIVAVSCNKSNVPPPKPVLQVPNVHQLDWQKKELFAFIHFTVNTFTDKEWVFGDEYPDVFNPVNFDPHQWVKVFQESGFKGVIITAKHHDGFCLWPSRYTEHCVKNSKWRDGRGDVLRELREACDKHGIE